MQVVKGKKRSSTDGSTPRNRPSASGDKKGRAHSAGARRGRPETGRRQIIVDAAAELSFRIGLGALTHRAVATQAGVPLGSTTYHFSSIEDIQLEVARFITTGRTTKFVRELGTIPRHDLNKVANCLVQVLVPHGVDPLTAYRWYMEAARIDSVRPVIAQWNLLIIGCVATHLGLEKAVAEDVIALADGLLLSVVVHGWFSTDIADRLASGMTRLLK